MDDRKSRWVKYLDEHRERAEAWKRRILRRENKRLAREALQASKRREVKELTPDAWMAKVLNREPPKPVTIKVTRLSAPASPVPPMVRKPVDVFLGTHFNRDTPVLAGHKHPERIGPQPFRRSHALNGEYTGDIGYRAQAGVGRSLPNRMVKRRR